jgi:hypothetical protein
MRATLFAITVFCTLGIAPADVGEPPAEAAMRARLAELERENQMLRQQWGQATMELDRVRTQLQAMRERVLELEAQRVDAPPPPPAEVAPPTEAPAAEATAVDAQQIAHLEAELARVRRQNRELQTQRDQLTELAGVASEGERVAGVDARLTTERAGGEVVVRTTTERLRMTRGTRADHLLSLAYVYDDGDRPTESTPVTAFIQAVFSGGLYGRVSDVVFTLGDGDELVVPITNYSLNPRSAGAAGKRRTDKSDETLTLRFSPEAMRAMAGAVSATGRMGHVEFELDRDALALFRAVQRRIEMGL